MLPNDARPIEASYSRELIGLQRFSREITEQSQTTTATSTQTKQRMFCGGGRACGGGFVALVSRRMRCARTPPNTFENRVLLRVLLAYEMNQKCVCTTVWWMR